MTARRREEYARQSARALPGARLALYRVWIVVGAIIIAATVLNVMNVLAPMILFLTVGSLVAFVASPIVNALDRHRVPRALGAFLGLVAVVAAVVALFMVIVPVFAQQLLEVLYQAPAQLRELGNWVLELSSKLSALSSSSAEFGSQIDSALGSLADFASKLGGDVASNLGSGVVPFISDLASTLFIVFLGLVLAYWLALDYPRIHREVGLIIGEGKEANYRLMMAILSRSIGGYMKGMVITSLVDGVMTWIGLLFIGHPYAALMGVLTGLLHLVPVYRTSHLLRDGFAHRALRQPDVGYLDAGLDHGGAERDRQRDQPQGHAEFRAGTSGHEPDRTRGGLRAARSHRHGHRYSALSGHQGRVRVLLRDGHRSPAREL